MHVWWLRFRVAEKDAAKDDLLGPLNLQGPISLKLGHPNFDLCFGLSSARFFHPRCSFFHQTWTFKVAEPERVLLCDWPSVGPVAGGCGDDGERGVPLGGAALVLPRRRPGAGRLDGAVDARGTSQHHGRTLVHPRAHVYSEQRRQAGRQ